MSVTCMKQGFDGSVECFKCTSVMVCQKPRFKDGGFVECDPSGKGAHEQPVSPASYDAHYSYEFKGVRIDPYRIIDLYKITHPAHQHALKKLLRAGRSVKDLRRDIEEVRMTLDRWVAMLDEEGASNAAHA